MCSLFTNAHYYIWPTTPQSCLTKVHLGTVTNTSLVLDTPTSLDLGASYLLSLLAYDHCSPETADMLFNGSTTSAPVATAGGILNFADVLKSLQRRSVLRYTPADKVNVPTYTVINTIYGVLLFTKNIKIVI